MSDLRLEGKLCIISGAAAGIGRETALAFVAEGAEVHAIDRDANGLERLAAEAKGIIPYSFDIADAAAVEAFHATLPRLDVQFNCAGIVSAREGAAWVDVPALTQAAALDTAAPAP